MLDERIVPGSMLGTDENRKGKSLKKDKKDKKEPKPRKPRELSVQKDINFFDCVKNDRKRNVKKNASKLNTICICGLVAIVAVSYAGLWKMNRDLKTDIRVAERFINDPMVKIQMDSINKNKTDVEQLGRFTSSAKVTHETMVARPLVRSELMANIIKCMPKSVTFNSVKYDRGIIVLNCKSENDIAAADFVNSLKNVEIDRGDEKKVRIFEDTTYEKVTRNIETVSSSNASADTAETNGFSGDNTNLPSNVTGADSSDVSVSSSNDNGIVSILKHIRTGPLVSTTSTNYKYDYTIIISLDNAEVDKDEIK